MTIYDRDFVAEQELQNQYSKPGVEDFAAESQEVESQGEEALQDDQDHIVDVDEMVKEPSEKELNFRALRESIAEEKRERERERARYERDIDMMRSHIDQMSKSTNTSQNSRKSVLDDMPDDDVMTVSDYKKVQAEMAEKYQAEMQSLKMENLENRARLRFNDYDEVIEKFSIPLLNKNKDFARAIQMSDNPAEFAYEIGKMQMGYQPNEQIQKPQVSKAERIVENARKPGTLSNARGGQPTLSKADYYASMSDADFAKLVKANLEEI